MLSYVSQHLFSVDFGRDGFLLLSSAIKFSNTELNHSQALDTVDQAGQYRLQNNKAKSGHSGPVPCGGLIYHAISLPSQFIIHSTSFNGTVY